MGKKKGQLFLVAIVFLVGMIFIVQQALFQYSEVDITEPFMAMDVRIFNNILSGLNQTIRETYYCNETKDSFENRLEDLKTSFQEEYGRTYSIEMLYALNCSNWGKTPPNNPLTITIAVSGQGRDTRGTYTFYHI
jgi:hypothetical protein